MLFSKPQINTPVYEPYIVSSKYFIIEALLLGLVRSQNRLQWHRDNFTKYSMDQQH